MKRLLMPCFPNTSYNLYYFWTVVNVLEQIIQKSIYRSNSQSAVMAKRYGLTMSHPPNICRIANKASRELAATMWKQLPAPLKSME